MKFWKNLSKTLKLQSTIEDFKIFYFYNNYLFLFGTKKFNLNRVLLFELVIHNFQIVIIKNIFPKS